MRLGRLAKFYSPLRRKGLEPWLSGPGASGPQKGIRTANVPWEIYVACTGSGDFDSAMYIDLQTRVDYDGLLDVLECINVQQSWANAANQNAKRE